MNPRRFVNVSDARLACRRVLPRVVFDYVDGGAEDEQTMHENLAAFRELSFSPRMAQSPQSPDLSVTVLGEELKLPVLLAPCGLVRLMHPDGPVGIARAAAARGTISVLSTHAGVSLEHVASAAGRARMWFQLYSSGGPREAESLVERAGAAGFTALVVTVDTPVLGHRERDVRHGVVPPLRIGPKNIAQLGPQILMKPGWALRMARDGMKFGGSGRTPASSISALSPFSWSDIERIRARWKGALLVKGVLTARDAEMAVGCGCEGVIVSNHGGRQLEGAPATLRALPEVVAAVGDRATVLVDGGVRRGSDVVKALALGARAVLVGRPYLYGLGAAGRPGIERVLEILEEEMTRTMALVGCASVRDLDGSWLQATRRAWKLD